VNVKVLVGTDVLVAFEVALFVCVGKDVAVLVIVGVSVDNTRVEVSTNVGVLVGVEVKVSVLVGVLAVKVLVGVIVGVLVGVGVVHPIRTKIILKLIANFNFFIWFSPCLCALFITSLIYHVGYNPLPTLFTIQENNIENKPS
jgi:hypothetical protein